ncbi:hypothetical protein ACTHAM_000762 [Cellulomonas soli]|uniref:hypothetical protein n=1 Tax=Cellulomonas soli TaxID=931535 RepID=UPI003F853523
MTSKDDRRRSGAGRRAGYAVALLVNVLLLVGIHVVPGWQVLPFLTDELTEVLPLIDASLVAGAVVNLLYLVHDGPAFKALTQAGVDVISLLASLRLLQVFPFDFTGSTFPWEPVVRVVLVVSVVGTAIAVLVEVVRFFRALFGSRTQP